jgi:DNA-binding transcriptional regulator YbjK
MAVELDVEALTPNQAARRQSVIDAAMKLAADGGYDAVQMRDVAG